MASVIEELKAKLAAKTAVFALSTEELEEERVRAKLAGIEAEERDVAKRRRSLELERVIDELKAKNPHPIYQPLDLEEDSPGAGHYVIRSAGKAEWEALEKKLSAAGPTGLPPIERKSFIITCVAWPDMRIEETGLAVQERWDQRPAVLLSLFNACSKLAGLKIAEDAKRAR